ncbi:hypothetical protein DPV78_006358 [Talaromyces pinophilus]|nr:hypothetical protein DPV78_006358 [Talaromyces pinophilus]
MAGLTANHMTALCLDRLAPTKAPQWPISEQDLLPETVGEEPRWSGVDYGQERRNQTAQVP